MLGCNSNGLFFLYIDQRFRRCLNEQLGLTISDIDHEYLVQKYGQEKPGMINYKAFEEAMEKSRLYIYIKFTHKYIWYVWKLSLIITGGPCTHAHTPKDKF